MQATALPDKVRRASRNHAPSEEATMPHRSDPVTILDRLRRRVDEERYRLVYCNRDIDLRSIRWIGFDMDYTLAIYRREAFDQLCHDLTLRRLIAAGYPEVIADIPFDPNFAIRGLVIDRHTGHILKMDAHRSVAYGYHGMRRLDDTELDPYRRTPPMIGAARGRYTLIDTLFELPEAWIYSCLVERLETLGRPVDYAVLADDVRSAIDGIHADGSLKIPIQQDIERFIYRDPDLPNTLHRLRSAGKKLFLMTNSYSTFTHHVMRYLLDGALPGYNDWKSYFDIILTGAAKPSFFRSQAPFAIVDEHENILGRERDRLRPGVIYQNGNLQDFERWIGLGGDEILYVGDHIYGDILRSKRDSNWRTVMIIPEMDQELRSAWQARERIREWTDVEERAMRTSESLGVELDLLARLLEERTAHGDAMPRTALTELDDAVRHLQRNTDRLRKERVELTARARTLAREVDESFHPQWGALLKQGNEHSIFGQQVETYACLYTSRVSNFLHYSPEHDFRSPPDLLPHELVFRTTVVR
jgi:5'-nucleotidase